AIERNVARLRGELRDGAELCAVVKADGYGHGAAPAAHAALAGGATWLAVATADEATQLRAHGVDAPLLVLGALSPEELDAALASALRERAPGLILHAASSAALLRDADSHFDLARAGVAIYGLDPFQEDAAARDLEPALELASYVAEIKPCAPGESAGYGRR